jgi:hypothetical protein
MPLDWTEVIRRYGDGAEVPTIAGGRTLRVIGADEAHVHITNGLWRVALQREHLEKAVELLEAGRITRAPGHFAEEYRTAVADERGTSVAHLLRDLGHLDGHLQPYRTPVARESGLTD